MKKHDSTNTAASIFCCEYHIRLKHTTYTYVPRAFLQGIPLSDKSFHRERLPLAASLFVETFQHVHIYTIDMNIPYSRGGTVWQDSSAPNRANCILLKKKTKTRTPTFVKENIQARHSCHLCCFNTLCFNSAQAKRVITRLLLHRLSYPNS